MVSINPDHMRRSGERTKKLIKTFYFYEDELLGKGTSGSVYRGYDSSRGDALVAIKVVPCRGIDEEGLKMLNREVEILYMIKGDGVVKLIDTAQTSNNFYVVMEYCNGGSLEKYLKKHSRLQEKEALDIIKQVVKAFIDLNKLETGESKKEEVAIMHRDLKPANLLFHDGKIKIADFGYGKIVSRVNKSTKMEQTYCGTPLYCCPQILKNTAYSCKCDVWSAGCILYEMLVGKVPFTAPSEVKLVHLIMSGKFEIPTDVKLNSDTLDLLKKMLMINEENRLSWVDIRVHPAIKKL